MEAYLGKRGVRAGKQGRGIRLGNDLTKSQIPLLLCLAWVLESLSSFHPL